MWKNIWYQIKFAILKSRYVTLDVTFGENVMEYLIEESARTNKCINQIVEEKLYAMLKREKKCICDGYSDYNCNCEDK